MTPKSSVMRHSEEAEGHDIEGTWLAGIIDRVAHLLPEQAPLHAFVHHNPLHAFEHLPFDEAVVRASTILGTEPYQSEAGFAACLASGRILERDIVEVLRSEGAQSSPVITDGPTELEFRRRRLLVHFPLPTAQSLPWVLEEEGGLDELTALASDADRERFLATPDGEGCPADEHRALAELWQRLEGHAPTVPAQEPCTRPRDRILASCDIDTDQWTHPLLIRFSASFLDQGVAYWRMPHRDQGMLSAFRRIYGHRSTPLAPCFHGLGEELRRQQAQGWSATRTAAWALNRMGVGETERDAVIRDTLLSLRGWAGMVKQMEDRPDRAPVAPLPARLEDYLAIQLVLDSFVTVHVLRQHELPCLAELENPDAPPAKNLLLVYEAFMCAQLFGLNHRYFGGDRARRWMEVVASFDELERRRLYHLAYERRHRVEVLDGLASHIERTASSPSNPRFQALFCIDDREESLRRHLEELAPAVETFGYAGFYGVAMHYQGLDDVRPRPLCPVSIDPKHLIVEEIVDSDSTSGRYRQRRARDGKLSHSVSVGTQSLVRGGIFTAAAGLLSTIPLIGHSLFPRLTNRLRHRFQHRHAAPTTRLRIERAELDRQEDGLWPGYTAHEMADIVASALETMGLSSFSQLVMVVGHGSSSLNNPHEAAHDCGATGGGRGGPNARAFAAMANHAEVRKLVRERGVTIPDTTWFVGAYHNTCDDSMTYYDEDLIPDWAQDELSYAVDSLEQACVLDAHERCRRFEDTALAPTPEQALRAAQTHALDLGQPRPEYGHATNAVCIVGRRARTRGLFLDRRAFLVSYDPTEDPDGAILGALLASVGPVGAGINLEYYFSSVDPTGYGAGTKLPHNIVGLVGVMDGHASDLRTGLPWQMVEIHEPVRLLTIVEAKPSALARLLPANPELAGLINNGWIQLVAWEPEGDAMWVLQHGKFTPYQPKCREGTVVASSAEHYAGHREHLGPASIVSSTGRT